MLDGLDGDSREKFMLHYNFPPFQSMKLEELDQLEEERLGMENLHGGPLTQYLKRSKDFPYTVRVVSEITESNGSSSMATVCGSSLALMDAGVPLEKPIAGIAMGLIKEENKFVVLTDILGDEDHLGDMDFKVAGTEKGIFLANGYQS